MTFAPGSNSTVEGEALRDGAATVSRIPNEADAQAFAAVCHAQQARKYTGEPYIVHPRAVREIVASVPHDAAMLCACWLHDVVEDCGVQEHQLLERFGPDVTQLVMELTDVSKSSDGNRAARKKLDREHLATASVRAKTIKLADMIDNSRTIIPHDPGFARTYLAEKRLLLEVLREGDKTLWALANDIVLRHVMLSCPFCGWDDLEMSPWPGDRERTYYVVRCGNDTCNAEVSAPTAEDAARKWNRTAGGFRVPV